VGVLELLTEGANGGQEAVNAALLLDLLDRFPDPAAQGIFDDLLWLEDPAAPTTIAAADGTSHAFRGDRVRRFAPAQLSLLKAHAASIQRAATQLRTEQAFMGGLGRTPPFPVGLHRHASNAIVISPSLSASGVPLLLGGPQTGLDVPSLFWEVGVHGGGYDAEGVIAPAGPGVLIGRGRHFAMTITSGILDNVDTFIETLDPKDAHRYRFRGRWRPFERRVERFRVANAPDVTLEVLRSVHGPVFLLDVAGGVAYSREAAFRGRELQSAAAIIDLGFVRSLQDFRRLADRVALSFNFHYADDRGNIAYFNRGARPLRPRHTDPRLPLDGRGDMEWRGVDPPRRGPSVVNPRRGFITNWNNKPIAGWSAGEQREQWGMVDRVQVFIDALEAARAAGTKLTPDDVKSFMRRAATSDIFAARIVPFLADAVGGLPETADNAPLRTALANVQAWIDAGAPLVAAPDRTGVVPAPGAAIYTAFRTAAQTAVFGDELGAALRPMFYPATNIGDQEDDHGSFTSPDALFLRVLFSAGAVPGAPAPAGLLSVSRDYFEDVTTSTHQTRAQVLVAALQSALTALSTRFGTSDQTRWLLPGLLQTYRDLGLVSVFGPVEQERENRGSFNLVVELGRPIRGEIIVPPGESGSFTASDLGHAPPHLLDQLPPYEAFVYRRQAFTAEELEAPVTTETIPIAR
jgi:penicillin amidase